MDDIRGRFAVIEDTRHSGYVEHLLADVLIIIMSAVLCGLDQLADIMVYAGNKAEFFKERFGIERIPSKPTMSRILNMVNGEAVARVIIEVMKEQAGLAGEIIAVDGKAIRRTSKKGRPHSALQILTAYLVESGVVLGQASIHEKTNEIPVFQEMLSYLDVNGKIITADAMHCQKETCQRIVDGGGNYVFGLKGNQKTLHDDVALFIGSAVNSDDIEKAITIEQNGGRIEKRVCKKVTDISWLDTRNEWPGLKSVFSIRRVVTAQYTSTDETNYYITSLDSPAEKLLEVARAHWKIESMHWLLDVVFAEDECALLSENGHKTLNIFRKLALLLHKQYIAKQSKKKSVKASLLNCLLSDKLLCEILEGL